MKKLFGFFSSCILGFSSLSAAPVIVDGIYLIVNQQVFTFSEAEEARNALRQQVQQEGRAPVSYTHLTLPTKRIV